MATMAQLTTHVSRRPVRSTGSSWLVLAGKPALSDLPGRGNDAELHGTSSAGSSPGPGRSGVSPSFPAAGFGPGFPKSSGRFPPRAVRSTKLILADLGSGLGSSHDSAEASTEPSVSHLTRSAPLPWWTWPHTWSRGRTLASVVCNSGQPSESSQCV